VRYRYSIRTTVAVAVFALATSACGGTSSSGGGFPDNDLTLIAASDPGGGLDLAARAVQESMQKENLLDVGMTVEGIGGGGGNPARAAVLKRPKDGYTVVAESNRVFLNPLTGTTDMDVKDFTPVAKLMTEYLVWVVKGDSKWTSARQVLDALKLDPRSVKFGVATVPSDDQFNILGPVQKSGVDPTKANVVAFSGGGDLLTNLLGGRVDVVSTGVGELSGFAGTDKIRIIAVSSAQRQADVLKDVPTWREIGVDFTLDHWRGIFGPAGMPKEAVDWWATTLEKTSQSQTWKDILAKHGWTPDFQRPDAFARTVQTQRASAESLVKTLGLGG
jgi:putative tricarboxylic transport membrane protein